MFLKHIRLALLWALVILVLCGMPGRDIPRISFLELLNFDKFVHASIFFVLILLTVRGFIVQTRFAPFNRHSKLFAFLICVSYGGALEIMQATIFKDRSADPLDFIANSFGVFVGLLLYDRMEKAVLIRLIK